MKFTLIKLVIFLIFSIQISLSNSEARLDSFLLNNTLDIISNSVPLYNNVLSEYEDLKNITKVQSINDTDMSKFYQGSVIISMPNNEISPEKIKLNVYNNFLISNSSITQLLGNNNTQRKIQEEYENEILDLETRHYNETKLLKDKYTIIIQQLDEENKRDIKKIKEYEDSLNDLNMKFKKEKDEMNEYYQKKIDDLRKQNSNENKELEKKENDFKNEIYKDKEIIENKDKLIFDLKDEVKQLKLFTGKLLDKIKQEEDKEEELKKEQDKNIKRIKQDAIEKENNYKAKINELNSFLKLKDENINSLSDKDKDTVDKMKFDLDKIKNEKEEEFNKRKILESNLDEDKNLIQSLKNELNDIKERESKHIEQLKTLNEEKIEIEKNEKQDRIQIKILESKQIENEKKRINEIEQKKKEVDQIKKLEDEMKKKEEEQIKRLEDEMKTKEEEEKKKKRDEEERLKRDEEEKKKKDEEERIKREEEEKKKKRDEEERIKREEEEKKKRDEEERIKREEENKKDLSYMKNELIKIHNNTNIIDNSISEGKKILKDETLLKKKDQDENLSVINLNKNESESSNGNKLKKNKNLVRLNNEDTLKNTTNVSNNTKPLQVDKSSLGCLKLNTGDYQHFLMNYQKCKHLNDIYIQANQSITYKYNKYSDIFCYESCDLQLTIILKDKATIIHVIERSEKNYVFSFNPSIFDSLSKIHIKAYDESLYIDFVTVYIYPLLSTVYDILPSNADYDLSLVINSKEFNEMSRIDKKKLLKGLTDIKEIDDRINIKYDKINIINDESKNNNYFSQYRYKSKNVDDTFRKNKPLIPVSYYPSQPKLFYSNSPKLYASINPFSLLRFKEKDIEEDQLNQNPCFNKGYYNKELNFTGNGNYEKCKIYIQKNIEKNNTFKDYQIRTGENSTYILDSLYKQFKFLFYEKTSENIYQLNDNIRYEELKNKVKILCSKQYSHLLAEYSKFNINNPSKLCFESTYLTFSLEKYGTKNESIIVLSLQKNKTNNEPVFKALLGSKNIALFIIMIISFVISIAFFSFSESIINYFNIRLSKVNDEIEFEIDNIILYSRVRNYLFYENNCYFKKKYGKDFELQNYDLILIKSEIIELLKKDEKLKEMISDCQKSTIDLKVYLSVTMVHILLLLTFLISFCLNLNVLRVDYSYIRCITTLVSLLFIILVVFICFKTLFKFDKNKQDLKQYDNIIIKS